jgi:hypothetical protein
MIPQDPLGHEVDNTLASSRDHRKAHLKECAVRGGRPMPDTELVNQFGCFHRSLTLLAICWTNEGTCGFQFFRPQDIVGRRPSVLYHLKNAVNLDK